MSQILVTTTDEVAGHRIVEVHGLVRGQSIRTRHLVHDFVEWLRNLVGAELDHYVKMLAESREQALDRMREHARGMGANAVVGVRFEMGKIAGGAAEVLVYGTAVRIERQA
jgi:uncharacterized protein YbjQ (UPF0145 family)